MIPRRPLLAALLTLSLGGALAGCGDQLRNSNPEVEEERLDQRREPPDATNDPAAPSGDGSSGGGESGQGSSDSEE